MPPRRVGVSHFIRSTFTVAFSEAGAALGEFSDSWVDTLDNNRIQAGIWEDADRAFSVLARRIVDFVERN